MVTINIGRKEAIFFGVIILVFAVVGFTVATWDTTKAMFHNSEDVKVTIDGVDYSLQEALDDSLIGGGGSGGGFGDWTTIDSLGNVLTGSLVYRAECDGFISFYATGGGGTTFIYVGDSSNPNIGIAGSDAINGQEAGNAPIKQGEYVKVSGGTPQTIRWRPIGDCDLVKQ